MTGRTTHNSAGRGASPFGKASVLFIVLIGFAVFMALLYFLSGGDDGNRDNNGAAHAAARGLNGYAGLVRMLEEEGHNVEQSRSPSGLETYDLLILTPPSYMDAEDISEILDNREYLGPTLVIMPKWMAGKPPPNTPDEVQDKFKRGWVQLYDAFGADWPTELPEPLTFEHKAEELQDDVEETWEGLGLSGKLPTRQIAFTDETEANDPLITAPDGRVLAMQMGWQVGASENLDEDDYYDGGEKVTFVLEPDLMNNYGLADEARAKAALALIEQAGSGPGSNITFDLTLNGFGGTTNLLTLAFRPPFLAATLCLLLAMFIVGWRAFLRFGPAAASGPDMAFGKKRLVANGAGLVVRAGRMRLLAEPYAALSARRVAHALGLSKPDAEGIDNAMRTRLPNEEPFTNRVAKLHNAKSAADIVNEAQHLSDLVATINETKSRGK